MERPSQQRASDEMVRLIRKLRWVGLESEATGQFIWDTVDGNVILLTGQTDKPGHDGVGESAQAAVGMICSRRMRSRRRAQ
jgi:hypothetical protein